MFIAEPQILLEKAQKAWDGFVKGAVAKYDTLDDKISKTGQSFEKVSGRIGKVSQVTNQLLDTGAKILAKYPDAFGETGAAVAKALPDIKEAATQAGEWALAGAALGSIIPGVGTAVGALAGGATSVALSIWDWADGSEEAADNIKRADDETKQLAKRWEEIKKKGEFSSLFVTESSAQAASDFAAALKEGFFGANEEIDKTPPKMRAVVDEIDEATRAQLEFKKAIDDTIPLAQRLAAEIVSPLKSPSASPLSAFDLIDRARSAAPTQESAPELFGPASINFEDFSMGIDIDEVEKQKQEKFDKDVAMYQEYASTITAITSSLTEQIQENIEAGDNLFAYMGEAAAAGVAQVLKQLSKMWSAEALGELARGLAALANPASLALGETAAGHFAAAAAYGAAAAATGVGGSVLGGAMNRRAAARNAPDTAPASGMGGDSGTKQLAPIVVNFNSTVPMTERQAQEAAAEVNTLLQKGARQ